MASLFLLPLLANVMLPKKTSAAATTRLLHPGIDRLGKAYQEFGAARSSALLWRLLLLLTWSGLTFALMRPQWINEHQEVRSQGYDLMLSVDLSESMKALDFVVNGERVSRLQVVKQVLGEFIEGRRGDRIGLVLFADTAYTQAPLTTDLNAVRELLDNAIIGMAGKATAIGDAIGLAVKKLQGRNKESRVIILLTDGANTAGQVPPMAAAQIAAREGIRIYTIAVGTRGRVPFPYQDGIRWVSMGIDEGLLQDIARQTGGEFFRATDTDALENIYAEIDRLEKTEAEAISYLVREALYPWPLGVGMAALGLLALLQLSGKEP